MIRRQDEAGPDDRPRFYAYCAEEDCGVCGPIRGTREEAEADEAAHYAVCAAYRRRVGEAPRFTGYPPGVALNAPR